jgi:arylsulfatase
MTDRSIEWIRQQKALMPDKPFFVYFAPGATHAPHHVPKEWIEKYKGKFKHGWDKQREITFKKQKELGLIGPKAELTPRHKEIPAWDEMDPKLKPVLEREMEVYAAFMEHTDHHVGRMIDALREMGELDNTLIYLVIGDNGASAEGTLQGAFNEMANFNGVPEIETPEFMMSKLEEFGGEGSYGHYAVGWAWAMNRRQWTKRCLTGAVPQRVVVHWPSIRKRRITTGSATSSTLPTVLERRGSQADFVNGVQEALRNEHAVRSTTRNAERHETQYFEMFCNRGIYHKGWSAVTKHRTPWEMKGGKLPAFDADVWELYDGSKDWTRRRTWRRKCRRSAELQRLWLIGPFNVLRSTIDRSSGSRLAGRPR